MKEQRLQKIESYIYQHGSVSLEELCDIFDVSKNTIRRDIKKLVEHGTIKKVYGGVVATENSLLSFENRKFYNQDKKIQIGSKAAGLINENDIVFIDSGTTTCQMLPYVDNELSFTLLTNSLDVINAASTMPNVRLIIIGNTFKRKTRSFIGIDNETLIQHYNINKAFMAATGISLTNGLTNSDIMEYRIKKLISDKSKELILLVDDSKFDHSTLLTYSSLKDVNTLITNKNVPQDYIDFFRENNIALVYT